MKNKHTKNCKLKNGMFRKNQTHDIREEMISMTEELSLNNLALPPKQIWLNILGEMTERHSFWIGLTDVALKRMVLNIRAKSTGGDVNRAIEQDNMIQVKDLNIFLQFNVSVPDRNTNKLERLLGYSEL